MYRRNDKNLGRIERIGEWLDTAGEKWAFRFMTLFLPVVMLLVFLLIGIVLIGLIAKVLGF